MRFIHERECPIGSTLQTSRPDSAAESCTAWTTRDVPNFGTTIRLRYKFRLPPRPVASGAEFGWIQRSNVQDQGGDEIDDDEVRPMPTIQGYV